MGSLTANVGLFFKQYGPIMLVGAGCAGAVGSTVYACKQTLKMGDLLEEARSDEEKLKKLLSGELRLPSGDEYSEDDFKHDKKILDGRVIRGGLKLYAGPALTLLASIAAIGVGAGAMHKQTVALSGTVATLSGVLAKYRAQVPPEQDREIFFGKEETNIVQNPETGEVEEIKKAFNLEGGVGHFYGKVVFDASNPNFTHSHYHNLMFLKQYEHDLNRTMDGNGGFIFVNDCLRHGQFKTCAEGQYLGFTSDLGPIDLGLQPYIDEIKASMEEGSNRVARPIVLDFSRCTNIMYVYTKAFGEDAAKKLLHEL